MERVETLIRTERLVPLRKGLTAKETYRFGNLVLGIVDVKKLEPSEQQPSIIRDFIKYYVAELKRAKIPIIEPLSVEVQNQLVVIISDYVPRFLDTEMQTGEISFKQGANLILGIIEKSINSSAGIDPTPKNFAVTSNGVCYADFFHPFTKEYLKWTRSHMDSSNSHHRYIRFSQDSMFPPRVYTHAVSDLIELAVVEPKEVIRHVADFCRSRLPEYDLEKEYYFYREQKADLKRAEHDDMWLV